MKSRWTALALLTLTGVGCAGMEHRHHEKEDEEGNEVKMTLDQVPAPVKAKLMEQAEGNPIKSVDKEMSHGKTVYETDVMIHGKNMEIRVAEDGTLIGKKEDKEEGEKD